MTVGTRAEVYARLAFEVAAEANQLERWRDDLRRLSAIEAKDIADRCERPEAGGTHGNKEPFAQCLSSVVDFVCALVSRGHVHLLPEISATYCRILDGHYGLTHAEVVSAIPLDDGVVRMIEERLSSMAGRRFVVEATVDPSIIGGLVFKIGDNVVDRSVRGRLSRLRLDLLTKYEVAR